MTPKKFLTAFTLPVLLLLTVLYFLVPAQANMAAQPGGHEREHLTLTWSQDPSTTQTISWKADGSAGEEAVQYVEAAVDYSFTQHVHTVAATAQRIATNHGDIRLYSATLTGLKPGTRYLYRVGNEKKWSAQHGFTTAGLQTDNFKFLVFGDSQSLDYQVWQKTLQQAYRSNPDVVFFSNVGDLVDVGGDYGQWQAWFAASAGVIDAIPVIPVVGNHETYTLQRKVYSLPSLFTDQFKLPQNGPDGLLGQVYSFDYGNVHFAVLDSQAGEEARFVPDMLDKQKAWLEKDLSSSDKLWKIVFVHRPLFGNKLDGRGDNPNIRKVFAPVFDKYRVDVVFTGHEHVYARTFPIRDGESKQAFSAGTAYVATGRSGTKFYDDPKAQPWNTFFYNPADQPVYLTVEVQAARLIVRAFKQNGELLDKWEVNKKIQ